jgi:hypothetical protein
MIGLEGATDRFSRSCDNTGFINVRNSLIADLWPSKCKLPLYVLCGISTVFQRYKFTLNQIRVLLSVAILISNFLKIAAYLVPTAQIRRQPRLLLK